MVTTHTHTQKPTHKHTNPHTRKPTHATSTHQSHTATNTTNIQHTQEIHTPTPTHTHTSTPTHTHTHTHTTHTQSHTQNHTHTHTRTYGRGKMADDVRSHLEGARNTLLQITEKSSNQKKDLKLDIVDSVSTLRNIFTNLKNGGKAQN